VDLSLYAEFTVFDGILDIKKKVIKTIASLEVLLPEAELHVGNGCCFACNLNITSSS
jgi:hypothetical protein